MEYDYTHDAAGVAICCAVIDRLIAGLKAIAPKVPLDEWLIISSTKQFNYFSSLFEREAPSVVVEQKEAVLPIPVEIKYVGVRWIMNDSLPADVLRIEAGKKACGIIKNLAYN